MNINRSTDVAVRKSPSVSATVYPKDFQMEGNDGNIWKIIVDSRGVHRWQKTNGFSPVSYDKPIQPQKQKVVKEKFIPEESDIVKKTKELVVELKKQLSESGDGYSVAKGQIETIVITRIQALDMLAEEENDLDAEQAASLMRDFLRQSFKYGGMISKLEDKEQMYYSALRNNHSKASRNILLKKLENLDISKAVFN